MKYRKVVICTTGENYITREYDETFYNQLKKALNTTRKTLTIEDEIFNLRSIVTVKRV
ncbi:hypothetical protein GHK52_02170 [Lactococcus garvieae]|nr:hypothetical protein [Lactococcus garvieae]